MRRAPWLGKAAICLILGTGLYASGAVLDRVAAEGGSVRLALLPAWQAWAAFVAMGAAVWWLLALRSERRTAGLVQWHPWFTTGPLAALVLLALPYLPWLPDAVPALQVLAGPARWLVWLLVLTQLAWVWYGNRKSLTPPLPQVPWGIALACVALSVFAATGAAAWRLTGTPLFPAGDEPHYLVIAQSLWRDGDLAIENNHQRGDYREYFTQELAPHYVTRGVDGEIYSIHPVGLPVLLAPVYALGGYRGVVWLLLGAAAAAATLVWRQAALLLDRRDAATFGVAAVVVSAPFLFNTFTVYPEIVAALVVVATWCASVRLTPAPARYAATGPPATAAEGQAAALPLWRQPHRPLLVGVGCGLLPWLSTKYAPMSAVLLAIAVLRLTVRPATSKRVDLSAPTLARVAALVVPYAGSIGAWLLFFLSYWGIALPQAPYGALVQTDLANTIFGMPGLLFDQEYGLLAYAPCLALTTPGLAVMWTARGESRRHLVELVALFGALLATVGAFRIWWGGSAAPGRPLASGVLLLGVPIAAAYAAVLRDSASRAAQHLLLWASVGVSATLLLAQQGTLLNNGRDGSSSLLEYYSPLWNAWAAAPTFVYHEAGQALTHAAVWLAIAAVAALLLRGAVTSRAAASMKAMVLFAASLTLAAVAVPQLPANPPQPTVDLAARARLPSLDRFDLTAKPWALVYDPLQAVPAREVLPRLQVGVRSGSRTERQPVRLLHNGRFSLPAGRYRVEGRWHDRTPLPTGARAEVALQVGRIGPPLDRWQLDASPGALWSREFALPLDAPFLGFRGPLEVEQSLDALTITPLAVVGRSARPRTPQVLAASRYAGALVFFHDEQMFPEPTGFWTMGGRRTRLTVAPDQADGQTMLEVRTGPQPNFLRLESYGWQWESPLEPQTPLQVTLPGSGTGAVSLEIETATGFVPSEHDPQSRDRRRLGAWVQVMR